MHLFFRDGSGCLSYWLEDSKPATRNIIPHKWIAANADEYHARNKQVHHRAAEVSRALDLMTRYLVECCTLLGVPSFARF